MIPPLVLDVQPHHKVLDMYAGSGSNTAQLIEMLHADNQLLDPPPSGFLIANHMDTNRCYKLVNQLKLRPCTVIINHNPSQLPNMQVPGDGDNLVPLKFDRILCRVPSAETSFKNHDVQFCVALRGLELLAEDGQMMYSTCSLNPVENEAVIHRILEECKGSVELVDVSASMQDVSTKPGMVRWTVCSNSKGEDLVGFACYKEVPGRLKPKVQRTLFPPSKDKASRYNLERCIRILPHMENSGGFVAVLRKLKPLPSEDKPKENDSAVEAQEGTEETPQQSGTQGAAKGPPKKEHRVQGSKAPFVFFSEDEELWPILQKMYDLSPELSCRTMFTRSPCGGRQKIYVTTPALRDFIIKNEDRLKIIIGGVKAFHKKKFLNLHGSLNWMRTPGSDQVLQEPKTVLYPSEKIVLASVKKFGPGAGMVNSGTSCYLNASLQALFHVPAFAEWLSNDSEHMKRCEQINGQNDCMTCSIALTYQQSQNATIFKPELITKKLKKICPKFSQNSEEDAHEFTQHLLDALAEDFLFRCNAQKLDAYSKETTPINQIFGGYMRTEATCLECSYVSTTFQYFQELILDIEEVSEVEGAMHQYFRETGLDGYRCGECECEVPASNKYSIERPPKVLCIVLKRFDVMGVKIPKPVEHKIQMDLKEHVHPHSPYGKPQSLPYSLKSMVTHVGPSPKCGHYTAIAQCSSETYHKFDDTNVHPIKISDILDECPYILLYQSLSTCLPAEAFRRALQSPLNGVGPKRKLSPPPKNSRDYGQQPAKYIRMDEQVAKIQKQAPKRFRTLPSAAALKMGRNFKVVRNLSTQPKSGSSGRSTPNHSVAPKNTKNQERSSGDKGFRVTGWPQPKVEPFRLTRYRKKEQEKSVLLRDQKTPQMQPKLNGRGKKLKRRLWSHTDTPIMDDFEVIEALDEEDHKRKSSISYSHRKTSSGDASEVGQISSAPLPPVNIVSNEKTLSQIKDILILLDDEEDKKKSSLETQFTVNGVAPELETDLAAMEQSKKTGVPGAEVQIIMIYPPPPFTGGISINTEDYACLGEDQFLNDVIIDFYLKYLMQSKLTEEDCDRTHVFSSFFYKRLTSRPKTKGRCHPVEDDPKLSPAEKRHARVKSWTKNIDIFSKDFIIIPINQNSHWFLAIICFPGQDGCLRMSDNTPIDIPKLSASPTVSAAVVAATSAKLKVQNNAMSTGATTITPVKAPAAATTTIDNGDEGSDRDEAEGDEEETAETWDDEEEESTEAAQEKTGSKEKAKVTYESLPVNDSTLSIASAANKVKLSLIDGIKQPCILIFDSLATAPPFRVAATLREYLSIEFKTKHGKVKRFPKDTFKFMLPKVPQQPNFTDCGLYLLQYVEMFFKDPIRSYHAPIKQLQNWFPGEIVTRKREFIVNLLHDLMKEQKIDPSSLPLPKLVFNYTSPKAQLTPEDEEARLAKARDNSASF